MTPRAQGKAEHNMTAQDLISEAGSSEAGHSSADERILTKGSDFGDDELVFAGRVD